MDSPIDVDLESSTLKILFKAIPDHHQQSEISKQTNKLTTITKMYTNM